MIKINVKLTEYNIYNYQLECGHWYINLDNVIVYKSYDKCYAVFGRDDYSYPRCVCNQERFYSLYKDYKWRVIDLNVTFDEVF